jgi:glyoxalase-like protein
LANRPPVQQGGGVLDHLDHLVLAGPDLEQAVAWFADLTGVQPAAGGSHVGIGTANYLVGLGGAAYLEIIGPDPEQPAPAQPRPFGIDVLAAPQVVTWAVSTDDLDRLIDTARAAGYDPGPPREMSRRTGDGQLLEWRLTPPRLDPGDELVPFLIEWGETPHPTSRPLPETRLVDFQARHPEPDSIRPALDALGVDLPVGLGELPALTVVVHGADGPATL